MSDAMSVFKEFIEMPLEDKANLYSEDPKRCKLVISSSNYDRKKFHLRRDNVRHPCHPLEECIKFWPEKPTSYREIVAAYSIEAKKLGLRILEPLCEGLGNEFGYFEGKLSEDLQPSVNHYSPCLDPSLTLEVLPHFDPNILTILLQGDVCRLHLFKDGEWISVQPLPNAFVIDIGYQLQVISNKKLKCAEHRAVTKSIDAQTSVVFFIYPSGDSIIEPAKSLVTATNPPLCRAFQFKQFRVNFYSKDGNADLALQPSKLEA